MMDGTSSAYDRASSPSLSSLCSPPDPVHPCDSSPMLTSDPSQLCSPSAALSTSIDQIPLLPITPALSLHTNAPSSSCASPSFVPSVWVEKGLDRGTSPVAPFSIRLPKKLYLERCSEASSSPLASPCPSPYMSTAVAASSASPWKDADGFSIAHRLMARRRSVRRAACEHRAYPNPSMADMACAEVAPYMPSEDQIRAASHPARSMPKELDQMLWFVHLMSRIVPPRPCLPLNDPIESEIIAQPPKAARKQTSPRCIHASFYRVPPPSHPIHISVYNPPKKGAKRKKS